DRSRRLAGALLGEVQQFGRWIDADDTLGSFAIEWQIHSRPDTDVENATTGCAADVLSKGDQLFLTHDPVEQARKKPTAVKAHLLSPVVTNDFIAAVYCSIR